jgi:hypothetical protein
MRQLLALVACLVTVTFVTAEAQKTSKPAKVVVTAEVVCMHCEFGQGDACATALKLDDQTPLLVVGDAAKELFSLRFKKKTAVVEGALKLKDKQMVLVADKCQALPDK